MRIFSFSLIGLVAVNISFICLGQQRVSYNLQHLLSENKLMVFCKHIVPKTNGDKQAVSCDGIVWLKEVNFSKGTIDIDLRGKDTLQQSFLGIAFHGMDTTTYDAIYFRPFNFRSADSVRKKHAVQYISEPDYPWFKLRESRNGMYEKGINPPPDGSDWFHARIVVSNLDIKVYVNYAEHPSLSVNKLNNRQGGLIGLWNVALPGDFANLVITQ